MKEWKHNYRATCNYCGETVHSTKEGEFVSCSCGKTYVDEVITDRAKNLHSCRHTLESTIEMRIGDTEEFMKVNQHV